MLKPLALAEEAAVMVLVALPAVAGLLTVLVGRPCWPCPPLLPSRRLEPMRGLFPMAAIFRRISCSFPCLNASTTYVLCFVIILIFSNPEIVVFAKLTIFRISRSCVLMCLFLNAETVWKAAMRAQDRAAIRRIMAAKKTAASWNAPYLLSRLKAEARHLLLFLHSLFSLAFCASGTTAPLCLVLFLYISFLDLLRRIEYVPFSLNIKISGEP